MKNIIRNAKEVQALLNGATQFRVPVVNPSKYYYSRNQQAIRVEPSNTDWYKDRHYCIREEGGGWMDLTLNDFLSYCKAPYLIGDEVFVKEKFVIGLEDGYECESEANRVKLYYEDELAIDEWVDEDDEITPIPWEVAEHMKEEQSRFSFKITNVRVERLQDISQKDLILFWGKEGFHPHKLLESFFIQEWDASAKDGFAWGNNPYIFVYDFEIVKGK